MTNGGTAALAVALLLIGLLIVVAGARGTYRKVLTALTTVMEEPGAKRTPATPHA